MRCGREASVRAAAVPRVSVPRCGSTAEAQRDFRALSLRLLERAGTLAEGDPGPSTSKGATPVSRTRVESAVASTRLSTSSGTASRLLRRADVRVPQASIMTAETYRASRPRPSHVADL